MKQGLYGLMSLDGSPLNPAALHTLGLDEAPLQIAGCAVRTVDAQGPAATSAMKTESSLTVFLGYLDEPEALASTLGVSAGVEPVALAWAGVERFGKDAALHLLGEWTLLRWDAGARNLMVVSSMTCRDAEYFSTDGRLVAIAPSMLLLTRMPWNSPAIDRLGLALTMSRAGLRHAMGDRTVWQGVTRIAVATTERFTVAGRTTAKSATSLPAQHWSGSFEDAVAELDTLGRKIIRQQLDRYQGAAFLLSGGLDSTLLTTWGALEQGAGREIFAVCSVAPKGSGLVDDRAFATAAAEQLGVRLEFVTPPADWSIYRPPAYVFGHTEHPSVGVRHYLFEALQQAADRGGARAVIDGALGEMTVTDKTNLPVKMTEPLDALRTARTWLMNRGERPVWPDEAFHVRFSREFMADLPREWKDVWRQAPKDRGDAVRGGKIGVHPSARKLAQLSSTTTGTQRHLVPFRDERLIRAVAPMPASFLLQGGHTRALARALLRNRVPDSVRLRHWGTPFSPDYETRVVQQAADAKARIAAFRDAGLDEWLDLAWLERELGELVSGRQHRIMNQFQVQITSLTAEFLLWVYNETGGGPK